MGNTYTRSKIYNKIQSNITYAHKSVYYIIISYDS